MVHLVINYASYEEGDKERVRRHDPTPEDQQISKSDLRQMPPSSYEECYEVFAKYTISKKALGYQFSKSLTQNDDFTSLGDETTSFEDFLNDISQNTQFLLFGEEHSSEASSRFLASQIEALQLHGFKTLAIEYDTTYQEAVDLFMQTDDPHHLDGMVNVDEGYRDVLRACAKYGVKVVCIDDPSAHGENRILADGKMLENLEQLVLNDNPHEKVMFYLGMDHLRETTPPPSEQVRHAKDLMPERGFLGHLLNDRSSSEVVTVPLVEKESLWKYTEALPLEILQIGMEPSSVLNLDDPLLASLVIHEYIPWQILGSAYDYAVYF
jgi:hypothetical protein